MIAPDTATTPAAEDESAEALHCIPTAALAIDGTPPEVGDEVEYTVKGKVSRVEEGETYVQPTTINDQPAALPTEESAPADDDDMMALAQKADAQDPS